jgi:hypothetical protein
MRGSSAGVKSRRFRVLVSAIVPAPLLALVQVLTLFALFPLLQHRLPNELLVPIFLSLWLSSAVLIHFSARLDVGREEFSLSWCGRFRRSGRYADVSSISREERRSFPHNRVLVAWKGRRRRLEVPVWSAGTAMRIEEALREALVASRTAQSVSPLAGGDSLQDVMALDRANRSAEEWVAPCVREVVASAAQRREGVSLSGSEIWKFL